jgi:hypothetical protein
MSQPLLRVSVEGDKYTVIQHRDGRVTALRHGQPWNRDLTGDKLILALAQEVDRLRREIDLRDAPDWDDL